jgi:nicotinamide-nucleotide amidase
MATLRHAVVLAIGSELLRPGRPDTNAEWLIARLADLGIETSWAVRIEDDVDRIRDVVRAATASAPVVIVTGGLGPTDDDRTREAIADALGAPLVRDQEMARRIASVFLARGRVPGERQARQADRPQGAAWIDNPIGSAPGLLIERDGRILAALPGVPAEMKAMFEAGLAPLLRSAGTAALARTTLRISGRPESWVDDLVRDLYETPGTATTILASSGTVELLVSAEGQSPEAAAARLEELASAMRARLGVDRYGENDDTLPGVVGQLLLARSATVATAESCTGGLLGAALTDVPGSSAWYRGGVVCYADDLKMSLAGVPADAIAAAGAVSEPVAVALAEGARRVCRSTYGLGITGIAGPSGGTRDKPVGTVHIALAGPDGGRTVKLDWPGDRDLIRRRATTAALDLLRRRLLI